jgi:uncharacterized pyridoxamine 5'-phosphate oxidase family protein
MRQVKHVLGISGGKDSSALAVYLRDKYPELDITYYFCDTGRELDETYRLIENLSIRLGKEIKKLTAIERPDKAPFDHFLEMYGGFLPSSNARWCTKKLKLEPFEQFVGVEPTLSYVAIRGDEDREGYISKKTNIQSIFPFRKNIWSQEIINVILKNTNADIIAELYSKYFNGKKLDNIVSAVKTPLSESYTQNQKLTDLLTISIAGFNKVTFDYLRTSNFPISNLENYPLLENEDIICKQDVIRILEESGVGMPEYYKKVEFELDGKKGYYNRSRSGCFFCFFQQKIEWIWLYENHRDLFIKATEYEKEGYTWMQDERLEDLIRASRIAHIKREHLRKTTKQSESKSPYLLDVLDKEDSSGCAACFV